MRLDLKICAGVCAIFGSHPSSDVTHYSLIRVVKLKDEFYDRNFNRVGFDHLGVVYQGSLHLSLYLKKSYQY